MLQKYSAANPPTQDDALDWYNHGLAAGLSRDTAYRYAYLLWLGAWQGIEPVGILSGYRSAAYTAQLQARWDRGDRVGLKVRPATAGYHPKRQAFDLQDTDDLDILGALAPYAGLRWGGNFADPDEPHFDTGR